MEQEVPQSGGVEAGAVGVGVGERVEVPTPRGIFGGGEPLVDEGEDEGRLVVGAVLGAELGENPVSPGGGPRWSAAEDEVPRDGDVGFALVEVADGGEDRRSRGARERLDSPKDASSSTCSASIRSRRASPTGPSGAGRRAPAADAERRRAGDARDRGEDA